MTSLARWPALDNLRGLAVLVMLPVNAAMTFTAIPAWFKHAPADGVTLADFVLPVFLFSLGVSAAGVYQTGSKALDLQGVISPIYLLNGIGAGGLTPRGEGIFGFNYSIKGTADRTKVRVNPLSILTPWMLRDLIRGDAPNLGTTAP